MLRLIATAVACLVLNGVGGGIASATAPCRDASGKFVKCPPAKTTTKQCRDANGKFVKCPAKKM